MELTMNTAVTKPHRILLAEDDKAWGDIVKRNLESVGYQVEHCCNGHEAWEEFQRKRYDLLLVDIMMPKKNGFELAQAVRVRNSLIPIFFLSAEKTMDADRLRGFELGADGYIVKPFSLLELQRRIKAFLKWTRPVKSELLVGHVFGDYTYNYRKLKVYKNNNMGEAIATFSPTEAKIIRYFFSRPNIIIKKDELLMKIWGKDDFHASRSMDVFVGKIRKQLRIEPRVTLETIFNVGLRLNVPEDLLPEKITIPLQNKLQ
ncbi:response regulator transcription factor [Chitinophaga solisilvae]|uniref:Response regulator transcription factor n=1 Tax=Chitinophaga solisilvae TaxID=1233460 RepID=A0A3S1JDB5_9BACT|nr:response regulator transcription factor [Chitinophaga solisilvae]NSL88591.1 response regulator transcription factor [Chitinophaga solisilvae]